MKTTGCCLILMLAILCGLILSGESGPIAQQQQTDYRYSDVFGYWDPSWGEMDKHPQVWNSGAVTYGVRQRYEQMLEQNRRQHAMSEKPVQL